MKRLVAAILVLALFTCSCALAEGGTFAYFDVVEGLVTINNLMYADLPDNQKETFILDCTNEAGQDWESYWFFGKSCDILYYFAMSEDGQGVNYISLSTSKQSEWKNCAISAIGFMPLFLKSSMECAKLQVNLLDAIESLDTGEPGQMVVNVTDSVTCLVESSTNNSGTGLKYGVYFILDWPLTNDYMNQIANPGLAV